MWMLANRSEKAPASTALTGALLCYITAFPLKIKAKSTILGFQVIILHRQISKNIRPCKQIAETTLPRNTN
jgi:hypothetical protein